MNLESTPQPTRFAAVGIAGRLFIVYAATADEAKAKFANAKAFTSLGIVDAAVDMGTVSAFDHFDLFRPIGVVYGKSGRPE